MTTYPVDPAETHRRSRRARVATAVAVAALAIGLAGVGFALSLDPIDASILISSAILFLLGTVLLVRASRSAGRVRRAVGDHYGVSDAGVLVPAGVVVPWTSIHRVVVVDSTERLRRAMFRIAATAEESALRVTLVVTDAPRWRAELGRALVLGPHDRGSIDIPLDAYIGADAAVRAVAETTRTAEAHGVPVVVATTSAEVYATTKAAYE